MVLTAPCRVSARPLVIVARCSAEQAAAWTRKSRVELWRDGRACLGLARRAERDSRPGRENPIPAEQEDCGCENLQSSPYRIGGRISGEARARRPPRAHHACAL
jgi:hypothetical protein